MKRDRLRLLRNIGIAAHIDAGKTTLTERILYFTGKTHKIGETHNGNSQMDTGKLEAAKGITISSAATQTTWKVNQEMFTMNIIDTPGHVDFTIEVERSLRVLDGMVFLFDAVAGVEPQSETVWQQAKRYGVPAIAFVNKMDRMGADFLKVLEQLQSRLKANPVALQLPIGEGDDFVGIIDLISMQALYWQDKGQIMERKEIPKQYLTEAKMHRGILLETLAGESEELMELYFSNEAAIDEELILKSLRTAVLNNALMPVLLGAAYKNKGIQPLLNAICQYLPAPLDRAATEGNVPNSEERLHREVSIEAPFSALAFKVALDERNRQLTFFRVYSGTLSAGESVLNPRTGKKVRIANLYQVHANKKSEIKEVKAGDIAATTGLSDYRTGDTLSDLKSPIELERMFIPDPVISMAIEAKEKSQIDKLGIALAKLQQEDPTFKAQTDEATGQNLIKGMGELHLEIILSKLKDDFDLAVSVGQPRVALLESVNATTRHRERLVKQNGGQGLWAEIEVEIGPADQDWLEAQQDGKRLQFVDEVVGGAVPKTLIPSVEKGFKSVLDNGPLSANPLESLKVRLIDGATHVNDSKPLAFEQVAQEAFRAVVDKLAVKVMEPIMKVEVRTPDDYLGPIIGGINRRRGIIKGQKIKDNLAVLVAEVPLSEMFGYIGHLRSVSAGRGNFSMVLSHYAPVLEFRD